MRINRRLLGAAAALCLLALTAPALAAGWTTTGSLAGARVAQVAVLLPSGKVLVAGGFNGVAYLRTAEVYDPALGTWSPTGSLIEARNGATAVLLPNGRVLVAGGYDGSTFLATAELYDPATGTWSATGTMNGTRQGFTLNVLQDGRVLAAGGRGSSLLLTAEIYDPASGVWSPTGSASSSHFDATATLLASGRVLVVGGFNGSMGIVVAEVFDPATGTWAVTGSLGAGRTRHTATMLASGKVLVAGGFGTAYLSSSELYDPATGTWTFTAGSMSRARFLPGASLLPSGKVLISGGYNLTNGVTAGTELFDPATGLWSSAGNLAVARYASATVLLASGRVLIAGGSIAGSYTATAEIYEPATGTASPTGELSQGRSSQAVTLLRDGTVLVAGGNVSNTPGQTSTASAEIYEPASGLWSTITPMGTPRLEATATLLVNGKVLVAGGYDGAYLTSAELFDPATRTWTATGSMATPRDYHSATLLPDGKVLVAGGYNLGYAGAETYDPATGSWSPTGAMNAPRYHHTATLLPSGKVLIAGGRVPPGSTNLAEIYDPATRTFTATGNLVRARQGHTATLLPSGKVLVAGGWQTGIPLQYAELYDPATGTWTATANMAKARFEPTATLLPSGKVLIAAGWSDFDGYVLPTELYDPTKGTWAPSANLTLGRVYLSATLLTGGKVLIAGGHIGSPTGFLRNSELYDPGLGFADAARPSVDTITDPLAEGSALTAAGTRFRGLSEASGGSTSSSATNYPVVQLRRLDNDLVRWLPVDPAAGWSDSSFASLPQTGTFAGHALATVFTNGIPSVSRVISIECVAPSIVTSPSPQAVDPGESAVFTVEASGSSVSYLWRKDGVTLSDGGHYAGTRTPSLTVGPVDDADAGTYDVVVSSPCSATNAISDGARLTVLGNSLAVTVGGSGASRGTVSVTPPGALCDNLPSGGDITCTYPYAAGTVVDLAATAGPNTIFEGWLGACTGAAPTCQVTVEGDITVSARFRINPPVANAGGPYSGVRNQDIAFDGSASSDPDGDALTYAWDFGDGATGTGVAPTHAYTTVGEFTVTLVVNDGTTSSPPATTTTTISNQPPIANAGPDQGVELGLSVTLNGTGSSDPDGDALGYVWKDSAGVIVGTGPTVVLTLPLGVHDFTLMVDDGHGGSASDGVRVTVSDTTAPAVTVTAPESVQILTGVPYLIQWTASDNGVIHSFDVSYSTDGGSTFGPVPGCTAVDRAARSCSWPSPGPATAQGRVRVVARDASGNAGGDDSAFTMAAPAITVTAPNTAVNWGVGSSQTIAWTSNVGSASTVRIEISRNGGSTWSNVVASVPNTGSYVWTVSGPNTSSARVRVSWTANPAVNDRSDVNFTIASSFVTVTAPSTSVVWTIGTTRTITWNHNLGTSASMSIEVSRNGGSTWSVVNASVPNSGAATGTYGWLVTGPATTRARMRVTWTANTGVNDRSNTNFTIR